MEKTNSTILLAGNGRVAQSTAIRDHIVDTAGNEISVIAIDPRVDEHFPVNAAIDGQLVLSPQKPATAILSSGTTGRPKLIVLSRQWVYRLFLDRNNPDDVVMSFRPPHWIGGMRSLIQPPLQGQRLHIMPNRPSVEQFWRAFRDIPFTQLWLTPTNLRQMKDHFERHLSQRPQDEIDAYIHNLRKLKMLGVSSSMIEDSTLSFWKRLLGNTPIINAYALTELGLVTRTQRDSTLKVSSFHPIYCCVRN
jgi:malonyl-CoA/methylmalonyl-CoA synthetase